MAGARVDEDPAAGEVRIIRALVVPADPDQPTRVIDLNESGSTLTNLQREVGGNVDVQAHPEGDLWVHDEGRLIDLPINVRVNHWLLRDSTAAKRGFVTEGLIIYGDVVITGNPDSVGDTTPVDNALVDYFHTLQVDKNALADWDTRNVQTDIIIFGTWPPDWDVGL